MNTPEVSVLHRVANRLAPFFIGHRKDIAVLVFWILVLWTYRLWMMTTSAPSPRPASSLRGDWEAARFQANIERAVDHVDLDNIYGWKDKSSKRIVLPVAVAEETRPSNVSDGEDGSDLSDDVSNSIILDWFNGTLKPHDTPVVPNIVHFMWFTCHDFKFHHLLSVLGAYRVLKAESILFHTDCEPNSRWWNETKLIPVLKVLIREAPRSIFGHKINPWWPQHVADVGRIQALMQFGGIYLDTDVFAVKSFEPLRHYDFVMGRPRRQERLNNGIIIAAKDSKFLRLYYESYREYNNTCYLCDSMLRVNTLAYENRDLIHIEYCTIACSEKEYFREQLSGHIDWKSDKYSLHYWRIADQLNPESIKTLDTTLGEVSRLIYYGNENLQQKGSKPKLWYNLLNE